MNFNVIIENNQIVGVSKGFSIDKEFLNKFSQDINYYALINTDDKDLLTDFSENYKKVQNEIDLDAILYPSELESQEWVANHDYLVNDTVLYDDFLYRVVQAHKSQSNWLPDTAHSLYGLMGKADTAGKIKEWKQPLGAHDAYNIGDKVLFEGKVYESLINANTWSPLLYPAGWKLV